MRRMNAGVRNGVEKICMQLYVDNEKTAKVGSYRSNFGTRFSSEKSKTMVVNRPKDDRTPHRD